MLIVPEPHDPQVPILPPLHADGGPYRYSMLYDSGQTRAYTDSLHDLCRALLDGYRDEPDYAALPLHRQYQQRYLYCKQVQVWLQATINGAPSVRQLIQQASAVEQEVLYSSRARPVEIPGGVWTAPIPLVLVTADYAPLTPPLPRPVSQPRPGATAPLIWLDPLTEQAFLTTLAQAGHIGLSEAPLPPRLAPAHPYDPQRGDGLRVTPPQGDTEGTVELWQDGKLVEWHEQPIRTAGRYWGNLEMNFDFARVTAWYFYHMPTCRLRLAQPDQPVDYPDPTEPVQGTIQFGDANQPVLRWTATPHVTPTSSGDPLHQWIIAVPLPPDAAEPTLPLQIAIAYQVFRWAEGDAQPHEWQEVAAVFAANDLHLLLPDDETGHWRLAGEDATVRTLWLRLLGLAP